MNLRVDFHSHAIGHHDFYRKERAFLSEVVLDMQRNTIVDILRRVNATGEVDVFACTDHGLYQTGFLMKELADRMRKDDPQFTLRVAPGAELEWWFCHMLCFGIQPEWKTFWTDVAFINRSTLTWQAGMEHCIIAARHLKAAGATLIMSHPWVIMERPSLVPLLDELLKVIDGVEVFNGSAGPMPQYWLEYMKTIDLPYDYLLTKGSDYHATAGSGVDKQDYLDYYKKGKPVSLVSEEILRAKGVLL